MEYMNCKFFGTNIFLFKVIISKICKEPNFVSFHYLFNFFNLGNIQNRTYSLKWFLGKKVVRKLELKVHDMLAYKRPDGIYLLKVDNRNTRTRCEISITLTIKTMASFWCLYCELKTYFTLSSSVSIVNFEHVIAG